MRDWYVMVKRKSQLGVVYTDVVEATSAEAAVRKLGSGPVRLFFKGEDYWQYVGSNYLYEVKEL